MSKGQNELIGKFKMVEGDVISIRGQMEFMNIPTEINRELVRFGMDYDRKGTVGGGPVAIDSNGQTVFSLTHIEGITLGAG